MNNTTNEEKALELQRKDVCVVWNDGCPNVREAALKMAEWKDQQFKEEKKVLRGLVRLLPINETNQTIIEDLAALLS